MLDVGTVVRVTYNDGWLFKRIGIIELAHQDGYENHYYRVRFERTICGQITHLTLLVPGYWVEKIN